MADDDGAVPGEADWLNLLRQEILLPEDIAEFEQFNPTGNHRFWHLLLLAFRVVESDGEHTRFMHRADIFTALHEHHEEATQRLWDSVPALKAAHKELGKALTKLKGGRPGNVPSLVNNAKRHLAKITRTHVATPLLAPPFTREQLVTARAILDEQINRLASAEAPELVIPRRNFRDHALRAIIFLAAAYRLTGRAFTFDSNSQTVDSFPSLLFTFHRVATGNFPNTLLPASPGTEDEERARAFLLLARDNRTAVMDALETLP